jgi:hypothetical protein
LAHTVKTRGRGGADSDSSSRRPDPTIVSATTEHDPKGDFVTYRVLRFAGGEPVNVPEVHALARAYADAWRTLRGSEPTGRHVIGGLGLIVEFGTATRRLSAPRAGNAEAAGLAAGATP